MRVYLITYFTLGVTHSQHDVLSFYVAKEVLDKDTASSKLFCSELHNKKVYLQHCYRFNVFFCDNELYSILQLLIGHANLW